MKAFLWCLVVILLGAMSSSTYADVDCSSVTNPPTVFFVNGMRSGEKSSELTVEKLKESYFSYLGSLPNQSYVTDEMRCVRFRPAHNQKEEPWNELLEVFLQSVPDDTVAFWQWIDLIPGVTVPEWFRNAQLALEETIVSAFAYIVDEDLQQHIDQYAGTLGKRMVIAHSQGNFYATQANVLLPPGLRIPVFAVATPEGTSPSLGYLTHDDDNIINKVRFVTGALPANAAGECDEESDWTCHGMKESYLRANGEYIARHILNTFFPPVLY